MKMASLVLHLLHLLLIISTASAWSCSRWHCSYYSFFGGSVTFTTKGQNSDGTYEVELRNKHSTRHCWHNDFVCYYGNCGYRNYYYSAYIDSNYNRGFYSCQSEVVSQLKLNSNLPFAIRFPKHNTYSRDRWTSNVRNSYAYWRMMAHVDLGTRSDTGESNRSPITAMVPVLRVNRNCPRSFNLTMFDPDGDRVRCRVPSSSQTHECGLCGMVSGFSLDQNSCTLHYVYSSSTGHHPIELVLEDFPKNHITMSYSTGHYTSKYPLSSGRYKRQATVVTSNTIAAPTITTTGPTTTTAVPTITTTGPTTITTGSTTITAGPTTTTAGPTTITTGPTTITAGPTTTTAGPTTITTGQTTITDGPTTTTAGPTTMTTGPTTITAGPTTTTAGPTTITTGQTTITDGPTTTTAGPTTMTTGPTTITAGPITTTAGPTTITTRQTTITTGPTTTTAASTTTITASTTTTAGPTTTTGPILYLSSTAPLSKIPLQFTVYVDSSYAPSCIDGDYFPVFLPPTPANGEHVPAFVNQTLEIKVIATAQYSTIKNLIISGPSGIRKRRISTEEYVIEWKPTENELNDHFVICFVSEATNRYGYYVYQSELRCVIVDVGHYEASVTCNETTITVEVEKTYHIRQNEDSLHLNEYTNPSCNLTTRSNRTHLVAVMSLNDCGTLIEEDEHNITFKNVIKSTDREQIISRQNDIEIAFSCAYPKKTNVTLGFTHKNPYAFVEKGFGAFTFQFEFFNSQRFQTQKSADTYPVEVYLKQMIFMQIEATTSIPHTELFVESCKATPYDNPNSRISYTIIEHGCVRDNTVQIYPSSKSQFRFGMQAFEFIGAHDEVYITCSVILCEIGIPGTRCSQGCITSNAGNHRSKREAVAQSSTHSISQGPLHLVKTGKDFGSSLNLGLNVMFIVGCLLVCAVVIYRAKRPKATYQRLPTSETD